MLVTAGVVGVTVPTAQTTGVSEVNVLAMPEGAAVGLELVTLTVTGGSPNVTPVGAGANAMFWSAFLMMKLGGVSVGAGL